MSTQKAWSTVYQYQAEGLYYLLDYDGYFGVVDASYDDQPYTITVIFDDTSPNNTYSEFLPEVTDIYGTDATIYFDILGRRIVPKTPIFYVSKENDEGFIGYKDSIDISVGFGFGGETGIEVQGVSQDLNFFQTPFLNETGTFYFDYNYAEGNNGFILDGKVLGGFPDLSRITVSVLDQAPAVPEPATWAMLIIGLAGAGIGMRRVKRVKDLRVGYPLSA